MQDVQQGQPGAAPQPPDPAAGTTASGVPATWHEWLARQSDQVNARISSHLNELKAKLRPHSRLLESVEYSLTNSGKRLRPILVLETARICGQAQPVAWPAALAIECIHTFSLIHDDLPSMDNDDLRRGKPTNHKVFGEGIAILAGDWLVGHAFDLLASTDAPPRTVAGLVKALAQGTCDMIVGQGADIAGEQQPSDPELVQFIHRHKTARLLQAACELGALAGQAPDDELKMLTEYGGHLGLAFQISDDLLDCTGTSARLGKRAGKDADELKQTYPAAFGLTESRRRARQEIEGAVAALQRFGERADNLRSLAWYVIERDR